MAKPSKYVRNEFGDRELTIKERMKRLNQPVRMSKEVKDTLKAIKQEQDLKSIDAVLKKILREQGGIN